jgi:MFS family permease
VKWQNLQQCYSVTGSEPGSVFCLMVSGFLGEILGWEYIFYCTGALGIVWFVFWIFFTSDSPSNNKRISEAELSYIKLTAEFADTGERKASLPPMKTILTSVPFVALVLSQAGNNWGYLTLMTALPTYLSDVQGIGLEQV